MEKGQGAGDEKDRWDPKCLDDCPGVPNEKNSGTCTLIGLIISIQLFMGGLVVVFFHAEMNEDVPWLHWINRTDKFHPQDVAIENRFFSEFVYHSNFTRRFGKNWSTPLMTPFIDNSCLCKLAKYRTWQEPQYCEAHSYLVGGVKTWGKCEYKVPYLVVWVAITCAFFGFAAVAYYARSVMGERRGNKEMSELSEIIASSSMVFLTREYTWLAPFVMALWVFLYTAVDGQQNGWMPAVSVSFLLGATFSASCGWMGMSIATEGNCRTAAACAEGEGYRGLSAGLRIAFRAGACMGIGVVAFGILGLAVSYAIFGHTEAMGGFGFGASAVALFARVGGGIYTKAADVGGDLCGKVEAGLDEDNPRNPATIADCVGDNVGDTAGMGADLFESFVGSIVAACVLGATEFGEYGVALPFYIASIGLVVSVLCTMTVHLPEETAGGEDVGLEDLLMALTYNVVVAGVLIVVSVVILCIFWFDPITDYMSASEVSFGQSQPGARLFGCVAVGLVAGILIGKVTEYFTAHTFAPTRSIARAGEYGPGPVVIQGLGVGMYSTVVPMVTIVSTVLASYYLAGLYGTAISCVGMLSTLGVTMSTDAYGPVSDNAGGIAEMCGEDRCEYPLPDWVRKSTDKLDALGNTTAATGKGFSNGSAVLAALTLLAAFSRSAQVQSVDLLKPVVVIGILLGALQPYIFSAMTMLSVNKAAQEMMAEVRRQFNDPQFIDEQGRRLTNDKYNGPKPDYAKCIAISTESSLREMLMPGLLAVFSPLIVGFLFGSHSLAGFLLGAIASGYLLGVQMSNTGGAWDNAKKWVEADGFRLKGLTRPKKSLEHAAVVVGDTIGDPFKDTSGPSLNILIKLMTQFSFVIGPLLSTGWHFWHVGLICAIVMLLLLAAVHYGVLAKEEIPDSYYEEEDAKDNQGLKDKLDFISALKRRLANEVDKLNRQKKNLLDDRFHLSEEHQEAWGEWQRVRDMAAAKQTQPYADEDDSGALVGRD